MAALRILGIDPGSIRTGYGIIDVSGNRLSYVDAGIIRLPKESLAKRLGIIYRGIGELISTYQPTEVAVEEVFFARDAKAALTLGQARGAAIVAVTLADLAVAEYAPRLVKQATVGTGSAGKQQIQFMVQRMLKLPAQPSEDAADGLAVAICHAHFRGKPQ